VSPPPQYVHSYTYASPFMHHLARLFLLRSRLIVPPRSCCYVGLYSSSRADFPFGGHALLSPRFISPPPPLSPIQFFVDTLVPAPNFWPVSTHPSLPISTFFVFFFYHWSFSFGHLPRCRFLRFRFFSPHVPHPSWGLVTVSPGGAFALFLDPFFGFVFLLFGSPDILLKVSIFL